MKYIIRLLYLLVFIASMALIVTGQRKISWQSSAFDNAGRTVRHFAASLSLQQKYQ